MTAAFWAFLAAEAYVALTGLLCFAFGRRAEAGT